MVTKEKQQEYAKRYEEKHPGRLREAKRSYIERNKEKIAASKKLKREQDGVKLDAAKRAWEQQNPDKVAVQRIRKRLRDQNITRARELRWHYNLTLAEYNRILAAQDHVCAICDTHVVTAKSARLFVDHDHQTGTLRALLCHRCNAGLGYFKEDLRLMRRAIAYVELFRDVIGCDEWEKNVRRVLENLPEKGREEVRAEVLGPAHTSIARRNRPRVAHAREQVDRRESGASVYSGLFDMDQCRAVVRRSDYQSRRPKK